MAADRPAPAGGALSRLRHSLQALALPAGTQLGLLPGFTGGAEEFALNFDREWTRLRQAARGALAAFGWPLEVPPGKPYEYIEW